jgi:large subunit ribosomal protein L17
MRHKNSGRKFDRNTSSRRAMFRNLAANLILHERIETTDAKAKELRRIAERLITKARRLGEVSYTAQGELNPRQKARRLAVQRAIGAYLPRFGTKVDTGGESKKVDLVEKVLLDLAKRFAKRDGGYTRIVKIGPRRGDNAPMTLIELLGEDEGTAEKKTKSTAKVKAKGEATKPTAAEPKEAAKIE